jgi:hypothetical protein
MLLLNLRKAFVGYSMCTQIRLNVNLNVQNVGTRSTPISAHVKGIEARGTKSSCIFIRVSNNSSTISLERSFHASDTLFSTLLMSV